MVICCRSFVFGKEQRTISVIYITHVVVVTPAKLLPDKLKSAEAELSTPFR